MLSYFFKLLELLSVKGEGFLPKLILRCTLFVFFAFIRILTSKKVSIQSSTEPIKGYVLICLSSSRQISFVFC